MTNPKRHKRHKKREAPEWKKIRATQRVWQKLNPDQKPELIRVIVIGTRTQRRRILLRKIRTYSNPNQWVEAY